GHTENGVYAVRAQYGFDGMTFDDLKKFRSIQSKLTGHGESHLNPEGVFVSNGPLGSSLPVAQGLALGDKLAKRDRLTFCVISDGACMEGEAKEAFAAIPGLANRNEINPFILIVSDNDTKLSGRISVDSYPMEPTFSAMAPLGWNVRHVKEGHNLQTVYQALEQAIAEAKGDPRRPVCLWVKTIKGYGVKETEQSSSGGHGFPLKDGEKIIPFVEEITGGKTPPDLKAWSGALRKGWEDKQAAKKAAPAATAPAVKKEKVQAGFARAATKAAQEGLPVISISADLAGSTGIAVFQKAVPGHSFDLGVAEANMISTCTGLSKTGFIPIADTFTQFGISKGNLPLIVAALSQGPVVAAFTHAGFQDAADGASHEATTYFAAVSAIPHTLAIAVSCSDQAEALMHAAFQRIAQDRQGGKHGESALFFAGREDFPARIGERPEGYPWGKATILRHGKDVVLVACGPMVPLALEAAERLAKDGKQAAVIDNPFVNRPDLATIGTAVAAAGGKLVTIEDHQIVGGMGAMLVHALSLSGVSVKAAAIGMKGVFGRSAYSALELYEHFGMGPKDIADAARKLCS
ncbi:MAG: thiamine pyrophosphate-dependent enzyme, partial [Verrucomicrobia bacterium]|nr:thiamine pyrophosphate-dependent enzyme [Verrucomicrobiota bacterium]